MRRLRMLVADRMAGADRQAGFTLIEVLVSVIVFAIVSGIFLAAVVQMTGTLNREQAVSTATFQLDNVMLRLDKQIRYADALNAPGQDAAGNWYFELETGSGSTATCTGWRWQVSTGMIQYRTWLVSSEPASGAANATTWSPGSWIGVASGIVQPTAAQLAAAGLSSWQPFTFQPVTSSSANLNQAMAVDLFANESTNLTDVHESRLVFSARNTNSGTSTNTTGIYVCSPPSPGPSGYRGQ